MSRDVFLIFFCVLRLRVCVCFVFLSDMFRESSYALFVLCMKYVNEARHIGFRVYFG